MSTQRFSILALLALSMAWSVGSGRADAATRTWTGNAGSSWTDAGNWGGIAPSPGDDLVFPAGAMNVINVNDFPAGTTFTSMTFTDSYSVSGNAIVLGAGGLTFTPASAATVTFGLELTVPVSQVWQSTANVIVVQTGAVHLQSGPALSFVADGAFDAFGAIDGNGSVNKFGAGDLYVAAANSYAGQTLVTEGRLVALSATALGVADGTNANRTLVGSSGAVSGSLVLNAATIGNELIILNGPGFNGNGALIVEGVNPSSIAGPIELALDGAVNLNGATLTLSGVISGPGRLGLGNTGTLVLANNANTFTGGVNMHALGTQTSTLEVTAEHAIPPATILDVPTGTTFRVPHAAAAFAGLTGAGHVDLPAADCLIALTGSTTDTTFTGTITGAGAISQTGNGHFTLLTNSPAFTGGLLVTNGGTVTLSGTLGASVSVSATARLQLMSGSSVASIFAHNGHLQIQGNVTSSTNPQNALDLAAPATLEVVGSVPAMLGSLTATGAAYLNHRVYLGQATLSLLLPPGFNPAIGTVFTLIHNDPGGDVVNTFKDLPEGALFAVNGIGFRISYVGGAGQDVTLTVVPAPREYLLSEGATSNFFTTDIAIANPNDAAAAIRITFLKDDGTTVPLDDSLPGKSQKMIRVNNVAGMAGTNFSTIVRSLDGLPLAVERTMSWDQRGYGAHTEHATDGPATTWYFAEGSQGFFHTYLLLANPQATANSATVQYLREFEPPLTRSYDLAPTARKTIDAGADTELANRSFGMIVTFDQPGVAERAMYFGTSPLFNGGHESAGATAASTTWFLAEGATGPFFETFVLLANPNNTAAEATLTYLPSFGTPVTSKKSVPPLGRVTVNIEQEDASLINAAVSTQVIATQPILVERSQYWPDPATTWYEAHNSFGVTALDVKWALADGRVGAVDGVEGAQSFILLANPGTSTAHVTITFLRQNGAAPVTKTFAVDPATRFNVAVGTGVDVPELTNEHFGALVVSDQPIAVEHALYWDANGQIWAAGTNATATRLP